MQKLFLYPLLILVFGSLVFLSGCTDTTVKQGEIASVNGYPIFFHEAEAKRSQLFSGIAGELIELDNEELQRQYRYVLGQLIEEQVICQFLDKEKVTLDPDLVRAEEEKIRQDYQTGTFEAALIEEGIDLELWRKQLRRRLLVNLYITTYIRPKIKITPVDIQAYYNTHKDDFILSEQWHFIQIVGADKKEVELARDAYLANNNVADVQKRFLITMHDVRTAKNRIPEELQQELDPLKTMQASAVKAENKEFTVFILLEKLPAALLDAATVTSRIEGILSEPKIIDEYQEQVTKLVNKAKINIAPTLLLPTERPSVKSAPLLDS